MADQKVTFMRLKVDLQCCKCYKKVKKVLCKFPQIRDQVYDEKNNIVTITVICCSPEKIRDKLCCKGCGIIKSIEILEPPKPKPPPPQPEKPKEPPKPKPAEKPKEPEKPKQQPAKPKEPEKPKQPEKPKEPAPPPPQPVPVCPPPPVCPPAPPPVVVPTGVCCVSCYEGRPGGPCFDGYGGGAPVWYDGYYGRPVYDSYGGGRPCYVSRCDEYLCEDNTSSGCTIV